MSKTVLVYDDAGTPGAQQSFDTVPPEAMPTQAAIANLNPLSVTLLADAAALVNTLLAELRLAGIIAP